MKNQEIGDLEAKFLEKYKKNGFMEANLLEKNQEIKDLKLKRENSLAEISNKLEEITEKYQKIVKKSLENDKEIKSLRHEKLKMEKKH